MKNLKYIGLGIAGVLTLASCSDSFLEEKKNYDNVTPELYEYYSGCDARVNDVYSWCLPAVNDQTWKFPSMGNADNASKSTEEYCGFSDFVNPQIELTSLSATNSVPDYIMGTPNNIQEAVYGRIRNINDVIKGIKGSKGITDEEKNQLLGQVYFFRAWCYYNLFKWYGGVSIVTDVQDPIEGVTNPRQPAHVVKDSILSDLNKSAKMLEAKTAHGGWTGNDYGRVTSGTALALKGRVLLLWASPLFNRSNEEKRWTDAYDQMSEDKKIIDACGYGLYTESGVNAKGFAHMFATTTQNPEAVFVTLYNNIIGRGLDNQKNNPWERSIRPSNAGGSGKAPADLLVDMFPMEDGKIPANTGTYKKLETSSLSYDKSVPFKERDPRFYRTFALPGYRWAYNGDASVIDANNPSEGANYALWNYVWYQSKADQDDPESGKTYGADNLLLNKQGVYVRKKSDDLDVNSAPCYQFSNSNTGYGADPYYSAAPLMEIRYAEVILNLAEAACGAGKLGVAVNYLKQIRQRAGYTKDKNFGLQANLKSNQDACMSAILYERQIEFAYEGKRFDDMRRWLLFDGGVSFDKIDGCPSTWKLTGWGGNTCTWLGFTPFNGQRRDKIEFRVADEYGQGGTTVNSDPIAGVSREGYAVDLRKDLKDQNLKLEEWYKKNLVRIKQKGDSRSSDHSDLYVNFRPNYYFLGFPQGAMNTAKQLEQTIGWGNSNAGGANGTFDPLAN